jgi:CubicO group peptidase (beta-lactamase class C family)
MAKSVLHAGIGLLVGDGKLTVDAPAPVPAWQQQADDPRAAITLEDLLTMRDGLDFAEDYVDERISDVIEMLFGDGKDDVAAYAEARPLAHPPGTHFSYSSGTSNIVSAIAGRTVGGGATFVDLLRERIFEPIGMLSPEPRLDPAGTFIGSSFVYATARDFARFGLLYLRDGMWDGRRVLPEGWVDHGRRFRSVDEEGLGYGAHWWVVGDDQGSFRASGYEGQSIQMCPGLDLVSVRLGFSTAEQYPALGEWRRNLVDWAR